MNTVDIRPAQCVTPPPSLTIELLQLQPFTAQAAPPQQLLLDRPGYMLLWLAIQATFHTAQVS